MKAEARRHGLRLLVVENDHYWSETSLRVEGDIFNRRSAVSCRCRKACMTKS